MTQDVSRTSTPKWFLDKFLSKICQLEAESLLYLREENITFDLFLLLFKMGETQLYF
jgi:hypothetical protein